MEKIPIRVFVVLVFILITTPAWAASGEEKDFTGPLKALKLIVPEDAAQRAYLGIEAKSGEISLNTIKADILVIEIFSMYCPHCQKHAPVANQFFAAIEKNKAARDRIRMIGIGVGNSPYEVGIFKEKYSPPFPLFDDRNSAVVNAFSGIVTPYYFILRLEEGKAFEVLYSKGGGYTDAEEFLGMIMDLTGIK